MIRILTQHFGWKLFSLFIAVLLWLAIVGDEELTTQDPGAQGLTTSVSAPIEFRNIPRNFEISSEVPYRIHLEVQGLAKVLTPANLAETVVILNLADVDAPGERTFDITQRNVVLPAAVMLSRAIPAQIGLRFERRLVKEVPVEVHFSDGPLRGYRVASTEANPSTVNVVGPESRVQKVTGVDADPIDLSSVQADAEFSVHASVPDSHVRLEIPMAITVRVHVEKSPREDHATNGKRTVRN